MTYGLSEKQKREVLQQVEYYWFYHVFREKTQYLWETAFFACRKILKRTAKLLGVTEGELRYLFWEELQEVMKREKLSEKDWDKISRRKELRPTVEEYWRRQQWEALKGEGKTIKGISGSTGEAIGEVCIVKSPAEFGRLKKGDILVCRYTDPEWHRCLLWQPRWFPIPAGHCLTLQSWQENIIFRLSLLPDAPQHS